MDGRTSHVSSFPAVAASRHDQIKSMLARGVQVGPTPGERAEDEHGVHGIIVGENGHSLRRPVRWASDFLGSPRREWTPALPVVSILIYFILISV